MLTTPFKPELSDVIIELAGQRYMRDAKGSLVPLDMVKPTDKLMDETVRKIMGFACDLSATIARFKEIGRAHV